jgi:hypothetical protein
MPHHETLSRHIDFDQYKDTQQSSQAPYRPLLVNTELTERNAKHQADAEEELKVLWPSKAAKAP